MTLKLNLGCGDKLYNASEGWINVDVIAPEVIPDNVRFTQSDLRTLPFEDNFADEIHAYHVVEHFYRQDVLPLLSHWRDKLKPGGVVILEQPDIVKCAANFLSGYFNEDDALCFRLGLLGMFGESNEDIPFMAHKWGWTDRTLGHVLKLAGFSNIRTEAPLTHMKQFRDFRIVGVK
jgi:SAM-dependent methyltransferase